MALKNYAFLVKHKTYASEAQHAYFVTDEFSTTVIGVTDVEVALETIDKLARQGVQLVELCGGFSQDEEHLLRDAIGKKVVLGRVKLTPEDEALFQ